MKLLWFSAILLFANTPDVDDSLLITQDHTPITSVNRTFFSIPYQGHPQPFTQLEMLQDLANKIEKIVYRAPENASLNEHGQIIEEKAGIQLNRIKFYEQFYNYYFSKGSSQFEVPVQTIYPRVDSELLSQIHFQQIGHYATFYNAINSARSNNIHLASSAINNYIVFPGETFSFNKVVGIRTVKKGYMSAPVIVKGELSEGIGGGICQVSSTLFNAVDNAGLKIIKRYSHSKQVPYVPPGRDATVSWYGPDFSFQNKYNQPILIRTKASNGKVSISIYSSDSINFKPRKVPGA
ncbi:VanW family protein [Cytobacillus sp. Hz8]|uniref:VanW family protein n=1 Tax=Cytobacillus sp. Hz8 TaxID=3347168 RepID=UPI0035DAABC9